jgi:hypothetical protein
MKNPRGGQLKILIIFGIFLKNMFENLQKFLNLKFAKSLKFSSVHP